MTIRLYSGDDMKSLAIAGVDDLLTGVLAIHKNINLLILRSRECLDHLKCKIVLAFERQAMFNAILFTVVRTEIPCIGTVFAYMSGDKQWHQIDFPASCEY